MVWSLNSCFVVHLCFFVGGVADDERVDAVDLQVICLVTGINAMYWSSSKSSDSSHRSSLEYYYNEKVMGPPSHHALPSRPSSCESSHTFLSPCQDHLATST